MYSWLQQREGEDAEAEAEAEAEASADWWLNATRVSFFTLLLSLFI
jgi:hypothetical protein